MTEFGYQLELKSYNLHCLKNHTWIIIKMGPNELLCCSLIQRGYTEIVQCSYDYIYLSPDHFANVWIMDLIHILLLYQPFHQSFLFMMYSIKVSIENMFLSKRFSTQETEKRFQFVMNRTNMGGQVILRWKELVTKSAGEFLLVDSFDMEIQLCFLSKWFVTQSARERFQIVMNRIHMLVQIFFLSK